MKPNKPEYNELVKRKYEISASISDVIAVFSILFLIFIYILYAFSFGMGTYDPKTFKSLFIFILVVNSLGLLLGILGLTSKKKMASIIGIVINIIFIFFDVMSYIYMLI
jgi:hypothetical protein